MATLQRNPETIDRGVRPTIQSHGFVVGCCSLNLCGERTQVNRLSVVFNLSENSTVCGNQDASILRLWMRCAFAVSMKKSVVVRIKRVFRRHTLRQSLMHFTDINITFCTPLRHGLGSVINCEPSIASLVTALFIVSRPADVARFVVPVLIWVAINTVLRRRSFADIAEERCERMPPAFTDHDSTSAVVRPCFNPWVSASLYDTRPNTISRCFRHAVCVATHGIIQNHVRMGRSSIQLNCSQNPVFSQGV